MHNHTHEIPAMRDLNPAFRWAVVLNVGYVMIEAGTGFAIGSLALLADAAHNLTDVAGLLIAWGANVVARRPPSERFSYGFGRTTILAALGNAVAILIGIGAVVMESVQRLFEPTVVPAVPIVVVATIGIAINTGTAAFFRKARHDDLNAEGAFLHMMADAAVSAGVLVSGAVIIWTGWSWLDPVTAIMVSLLIGWTAFGLLRSSFSLVLDAVPASIVQQAVAEWLETRPGVSAVHDLHIWALSSTSIAITAHLIMPGGHPGDAFLDQLADELSHRFGIGHATLQVELGDGAECRLAPTNII